MTNMNDVIRGMRDRGQTPVITSEPEEDRRRAELVAALDDGDPDRIQAAREAIRAAEPPTTSFSGGVHRAVEPAKTPNQQMNETILRRWRGH